MIDKKLLIEQLPCVPDLFEGKDKMTRLRFKFAEADVVNRNKRRYPEQVLSHAIKEAQKKIDQGDSIYGSLGHLKEFSVGDISHRILSLELRGKEAIAEAAILGTSKGRDLLEVLRGGGNIGVSARGRGNVISESGVDVVQSDYELAGIDMVIDPSFDAHISAANIFESASFAGGIDPHTLLAHYREALAAGRTETFAAFIERYFNGRK